MSKILVVTFMVLIFISQAAAADQLNVQVKSSRPGATVSLDRTIADGKIVVTVSDAAKKPIHGLTPEDFDIFQFGKKAKVLAVESYKENLDVPRNIVLVLDNSDSMRQRGAVAPMLAAMDELFKIVRPIDQVSIVAFNDRGTERFNGRDLQVRTFRSNQPIDLKNFVSDVYRRGMTSNTVLYEGVLAGVELIRKMPAEQPRFMVVFSDGEDMNSAVKPELIKERGKDLEKFDAYAIDYMPGAGINPFLAAFASRHQGQVWKATAETNLVPLFQEVATKLQYHYVVTYAFPLEGRLAVAPQNLTVEEIKTIDASPMLGHIYFAPGSAAIPDRYVRFNDQAVTRSFDESRLRGSLEKYYQVLNVLGKRLADHPEAKIRLDGCNADSGVEKGNKSLSLQRAEAVKAYLQYIWSIAPDRMQVEARNLPEQPSTTRMEEGQADNRRVVVQTEQAAVLDLVRSTYTSYRFDAQSLLLNPAVESPYGIANWHISITGGDQSVASLSGQGSPQEQIVVPLQFSDVSQVAASGALEVVMEVEDNQGQKAVIKVPQVAIRFIQTRQRLAEKLDYRVQEKYALILFDFDKATIDQRNKIIIAEIVARIRELPQAIVKIVGHTDNIGADEYNDELSELRAKVVYNQLMEFYGDDPDGRIIYSGVGSKNPLYDNLFPETRALNRTVTITFEYLASE